MSTVNQDELKAIKVLKFTGKETEWDHWSDKFVAVARARGFAGILLGTGKAPRADKEIDKKKSDGSYEVTEAERKEKKRLRQANGNAYICSCHVRSYLMTWSPWQKQNSQMDVQEMHGKGKQVSMTSLKVKTRSPCCQCFSKINWKMSEPISQFG